MAHEYKGSYNRRSDSQVGIGKINGQCGLAANFETFQATAAFDSCHGKASSDNVTTLSLVASKFRTDWALNFNNKSMYRN